MDRGRGAGHSTNGSPGPTNGSASEPIRPRTARYVVMRRTAAATLLALLPLLNACDGMFCARYLNVEVPAYDAPEGLGYMPQAYQVGDTITFEAQEREADCSNPHDHEPSTRNGRPYRWASGNKSVADVIGEGIVVMRSVGTTFLRVNTNDNEQNLEIIVVPRIASVEITPASATISVGDTLSYTVIARDAAGKVIAEVGRSNHTAVVLNLDAGWPNPIAGNIVTPEPNPVRYLYQGFRAGTVKLQGIVPIFGAQKLSAEATLVVQ